MIKEQLTAYELILDMIKGKTGHISKVTYTPQKPSFAMQEPMEQPFPRCTPEEQGISSRYLAEFIREVAGKRETDIHGIMILRNGYVIGEYSFAPYQKGIWHIEHSLCKSITGMAIGLLIAEGKLALDDKVVKIFSKGSLLGNMRQKNITVEHLLTMTSGVVFNELGIVSGDDWVKSFFDSPVSGPPGERFEYNSMNTYMLSAIVTEITGETLVEYLTPRLFEPLGIRKFFWESCPKGITKGGWGLFLCQEDAAKLGQLYLNQGVWKGQQLIPAEWVAASTSKKADTPPEMGYHGYGYQMWMCGSEGSFNFNGMLGQNVVVYPDLRMVLVLNAASDELFQNCILLNLVRKYFVQRKMGVSDTDEPVYETYAPPARLDADPAGLDSLKRTVREMETGLGEMPQARSGGWSRRLPPARGKARACSAFAGAYRHGGAFADVRRHGSIPRVGTLEGQAAKQKMRQLAGKEYRLDICRAGIFPLIMQVFHNNFTDGISQIGFFAEGDRYGLSIREGNEDLKLEVGLRKAAVSEVSIHGEPYLVGVKGTFARNEDDYLVLKLDIAFLEEAARRKIKIIFIREDRIKVCFDETPGKNLIMEGLESMMKAMSEKAFLKNLMELGSLSVPELLVEQTIRPETYGRLSRATDDEQS